MKIKQIRLRKDQTPVEATKEAVIWTVIAYAKMYKLLHKQLWEKHRVNLVDYEFTYKGKQVKPIKNWNIKSSNPAPYSSSILATNALGLNQLFMGQDPYSTYTGNLKDGIYHDDCYIVPKTTDLDSANTHDNHAWTLAGNGSFLEYDIWGNLLCTGVDIDPTPRTVVENDRTLTKRYYTVHRPTGDEEYQLLKECVEVSNGGEGPPTYNCEYPTIVTYGSVVDAMSVVQYCNIPDFTAKHGAVVTIINDVPIVQIQGEPSQQVAWYIHAASKVSKTYVYADGTCIEFISPQTYHNSVVGDGDAYDEVVQVPARMRYLALVYLDTGNLVQNRTNFVENWDDMFTLYVHEDGYWYTGLITIVVIVASIVLTGWLTGWSTIAMLGAGIGAIGAVSGSKLLQVIGAIMGIYSFISTIGKQGVTELTIKEGIAAGASPDTVIKMAIMKAADASFGELFQGFISEVGFKNWLQIGLKLQHLEGILDAPDPNQVATTAQDSADDTITVTLDIEKSNHEAVVNPIAIPYKIIDISSSLKIA